MTRVVHRSETVAVQDLNVLALLKGSERFVFVYDDDSRSELIADIRDKAADPDVTMNWFDAAVLTDRAKQQATRETPDQHPSRM